jgi:hypothetical protein
MTKPIAAVVVDPYSSGRYLLYELKSRNIPIICIRSSLKLGSFFLAAYDKHKDYFAETIDYDENFDHLLAALVAMPYEVRAVFPGCEPGVTLADLLANTLKLPTANSLELSKARKDKAEMQEQLRRCGVPACEQFLSGDMDELLAWAQKHGQWPLVAKPCCSSGSDGIFFCKSEDDIREAHATLIGTYTPNATLNAQIVLQEFLDGTEYIVDTVSHAGRHLCVACWVYSKRRGTPWNPHCIVSEGNRLLPGEGDLQDLLIDYVFRVLDAVGMKYGPCHTEVMMVKRGPILVEVNARLHGLQGPQLIGLATGTSQATYAVDVMLDDAKLFNSHYKPPPGRYVYPLNKECLQMVLINSTAGYLQRGIANAIYELKLPSVIKVLPAAQKGQWLSASCDLNTTAGCALLLHESAEQLDSDRARIRREEDCGLYVTTPDPAAELIATPSPTLSPMMPSPALAGYPHHTPPVACLMPAGHASLSPMPSPSLNPLGPTPQAGDPTRPSPTQSPRLQSLEKVEEAWAAVNGFALDAAPTGLVEPMDKMTI